MNNSPDNTTPFGLKDPNILLAVNSFLSGK